jgi:hypothetical protein
MEGTEPKRPETPNDPAALKIAIDWYIFGFQGGYNVVRDSRNHMMKKRGLSAIQ